MPGSSVSRPSELPSPAELPSSSTDVQDKSNAETAALRRIGKIVGFHGLKGDVKIRPSSKDADWADTLDEVILETGSGKTQKRLTLSITHAKLHDRLVLCRFEGYPDRTSVEAFMNAELWAQESDLAPLEEGEFYVDDIIGLNVLDHKTRSVLGTVNDLVTSGDQDYLEICHEQTRDKVLIPLNEHFVPEINADEKFLTLDHLDGFFDDADRI